MYICLEKDLEKWKKTIDYSHWYRIIKLKATGEVFWTVLLSNHKVKIPI